MARRPREVTDETFRSFCRVKKFFCIGQLRQRAMFLFRPFTLFLLTILHFLDPLRSYLREIIFIEIIQTSQFVVDHRLLHPDHLTKHRRRMISDLLIPVRET